MKKHNALETGDGRRVRATGRCYSFRIKGSDSFLQALSRSLFPCSGRTRTGKRRAQEVLAEHMPAGQGAEGRSWEGQGQSMRKGNARREAERGGVRGTDSLCLRCGGTVRGVPWKEPCPGEKEGAEYPPCVERDGVGGIIKKGTEK